MSSRVGRRDAVTADIILSNGQGLFPLRLAAAEMARRGRLRAFIAAGYPTPALVRLARGPLRLPARLRGRRADIPDNLVHPQWSSEVAYHIANATRRLTWAGKFLGDAIDMAGRAAYGRGAAAVIRRLGPNLKGNIYHYRAGYGLGSASVARLRGCILLCEHSIAHPAVLAHLVDQGGQLPPAGGTSPIDANWRAISRDIEQADHVLVNSDFVAATFAHQSWPADRLHVLYRGIDDSFVAALPPRQDPPAGKLRLAFAATLGVRKGVDTLASALAMLDDIDLQLDICGPIGSDRSAGTRHLLRDGRVRYHGVLKREGLGRVLSAADVFVFPSLAEGSARVVFEALAAGCYVVTTENAGSIVADGVHGAIVPPADPAALAAALREAAADRGRLVAVGRANAALVRRHYHQGIYGDRLAALYGRLIDERHDDL